MVANKVISNIVKGQGQIEELRELAAQAAVHVAQARGAGTLRAYASAWRLYNVWCDRLGLPALNGEPRLVGMYLTAAAERLAGVIIRSQLQ
ncbi:MAG: hypothetical protein WCF85_04405 [Rhodospirillaceae bacterium]